MGTTLGHHLPLLALASAAGTAPGEPPRTALCATESPGRQGPSVPSQLGLPAGPLPARLMCGTGPHPGTAALGTAGTERGAGPVQTLCSQPRGHQHHHRPRSACGGSAFPLPGSPPPPAAPTCPRPRRRPAPSPLKIKRPSAALPASAGFARCVRALCKVFSRYINDGKWNAHGAGRAPRDSTLARSLLRSRGRRPSRGCSGGQSQGRGARGC